MSVLGGGLYFPYVLFMIYNASVYQPHIVSKLTIGISLDSLGLSTLYYPTRLLPMPTRVVWSVKGKTFRQGNIDKLSSWTLSLFGSTIQMVLQY